MAENFYNATQGSGVKFHTWDRTIGANTVHDEFTLPGEYPLASYTVIAGAVSIATLNDHVLQIMAGGSLHVRIRRIRLSQGANATTAVAATFNILRLTTAGTGGTSITPGKLDTADAASGATAMTLPTVKGTESTIHNQETMTYRQAVLGTAAQQNDRWEWKQLPGTKPIIIPAGTANGIAVKTLAAVAGATVNVYVELVETSFL